MAWLGSAFMALSLGTALLTLGAGLLGIWRRNEDLLILSRQALFLHAGLVISAMFVMVYLLVVGDFSVKYVVDNVNHALPFFYRLTAVWAGQEGAILTWNFLLVIFSVIAVKHIQEKEPILVPHMIIILAAISLFFSIVANFSDSCDAFRVFTVDGATLPLAEGRGLNPLLHHWAMIIHPPMLLIGYVAFTIPFAIAMSALINSRINLNWTRLVRRWTLFSWFSLGAGIMLGGKWAYEELGWGGYWGWDPVENASLMPWLAATAFLHSILVQERRQMFKVWNMILVAGSFWMCIFGTFLTRSGLISSVHAFGQSDTGLYFWVFLVILAVSTVSLIIARFSILKSDRQVNSLLSREAGFLFNNVLLLVMMFTVLYGTLYPAFTELLQGEKISLTSPWFNKFIPPMGLFLLFLTGAGPLLAWRKTAMATLVKNFRFPVAVGLLTFIIYAMLRYLHAPDEFSLESLKWMAGLSFSLSAFVLAGVSEEFIRTTLTRIRITKESFFRGFVLIFFQNKRRYMGYAIHIGLAFMFIGFTGKAFTTEGKIALGRGEAETFGDYLIEVADYGQDIVPAGATKETYLYISQRIDFNVYRDNRLLGSVSSEKREYPRYSLQTGTRDQTQETSEPGIFTDGFTDVYLHFGGVDESGRIVIQIWINPLVWWVWFGALFYTAFLMILLSPLGESGVVRLWGKEWAISPNAAVEGN